MLSCDWGTTSFRLRLVDTGTGAVLCESLSGEGIRSVYHAWVEDGAEEHRRAGFYLAIIKQHIGLLQQQHPGMKKELPVVISGMASSTIGIKELPYTPIPFFTDGSNLLVEKIAKTGFFAHELFIISGACTASDVMRGEETQLAGCAGENPEASQFFIFPGTHSKHVLAEGGKVLAITTYMTGELFSLMADHSILASSVQPGSDAVQAANAFQEGVTAAQGRPLSHALFLVRTNQLFKRFSLQDNYHYLSGLLIGAELGSLQAKPPALLTISGEEKILPSYIAALDVLGIRSVIKTIDAATASIRGQLAVYRRVCR